MKFTVTEMRSELFWQEVEAKTPEAAIKAAKKRNDWKLIGHGAKTKATGYLPEEETP